MRLFVLLAVGAMVVSGLSASSRSPSGPPVPAPVAEAPDEASAMAAAQVHGARVEVAGLRSETSRTFANPNGTMTLEQSVVPVRVRQGDGWVDPDTTLTRKPDGSIGPRATGVAVSFSPGGNAPLARLAAGRGELVLSWPRPLPPPEVDGDTATYPDVHPGVDLRVRATARGFGHEIVVRTRQAAANPELARIIFGLAAPGVRLAVDGGGNLTATDESGAAVFHASAPLMWDSPADDSRPPIERPVGVELGADTLTLLPDTRLLGDPAARLPIVIDPTYSGYTPSAGSSWTLVRRSHPTQSHWNLLPRDDDEREKGVARVGHAPGWPAAYLDRSLFQFDTAPVRGATIVDATFKIYQVWKNAHSCDANVVDPMVLRRTDGIGPWTTWDAQPAWHEVLSSVRSVPKLGYCNPDWVGMDAKYAFQLAANGNWSSVTLGLHANDEAGDNGWKRFYVQDGIYPHVSVTYNRKPNKPANVDTEPHLTACRWCDGTPYVGPTSINLKGTVSDPDGGQVTAKWEIRKPGLENRQQTLASGSTFRTSVDTRTIPTGTRVTWSMHGTDGALTGESVSGPSFIVDTEAPANPPTVEARLYDDDNRWHGGIGVPDTFTFGPADVSDVDHYLWGWTDPPSTKVDADARGGSATVTTAPPGDGPRTLYVRSKDRAGNESPTTEYRFYVRAGNGPLAQWSFEGNANDTAFLGDRHGTLHGNATYRPGAVSSAIQLDGLSGSFVSAPNTVRTDTSFSVSAWVKLPVAGQYARAMVSQDGAAFPGYVLWYRPDNGGHWVFGMSKSEASYQGTDMAVSAAPAQADVWTHLAGVYHAPAGQLRLYVNGVLAGSTARTGAPWDAEGPVRIGATMWNGAVTDFLPGAVDEVQLYDRVVSDAEIRAAVTGTNVQVAHWKFDEATELDDPGTTARNAVDGGDMAVLANGATFTPEGAANGAVQLDGVDDHVFTNGPAVRTDQSFTVMALVRLNRVDAGTYTVLSQDGDRICGFCLQYQGSPSPGRWVFVMPRTDSDNPSGFDWVATPGPTADEWTHLAAAYDADANTLRLYVDGELAGERPRVENWVAAGAFVIGRAKVVGSPAQFLPGAIDEVRVYSRAIGEEELRGIVTQSNVTAGAWKLDGSAQDSSGRNLHGTPSGGADWTAGQTTHPDPADLAVRLDGAAGHVSTGHAIDTARSFSVSAWVRPDRLNTAPSTMVSQDGSRVSAFKLGATSAGRWSFVAYESDVDGGGGVAEAIGGTVQVGVWTHLAAVYSKSRQRIELYVNGVLAGSAAHTGGFDATGGLRIGRARWNGGPAEYFPGAIDDVTVYTRTLFADEIQVQAGRDLTLVHNWQLDEPSGTNAADAVGARGGTLAGGTRFGPGRVGNSVQLDGVDDRVSTTGVDLRTDQSFTVAAWVYLNANNCDLTAVPACRVDAVTVDGNRTSKFRLGHVVDSRDAIRGKWIFEMPESDTDVAPVTEAALSVLPGELNTWVHLVGAYHAPTGKLWLYVNGDRKDDGTLNTPWRATGGLQIGRGKVAGQPAEHWPGSVDDVRLYTGMLDKERIGSLYRSYPAPASPPELPTADAGYWTFDENSGTSAADSSGRGLTATLRGGAGWIAGRKGPAAWFDGTTGYAATAGPALNTGQSFSAAAWVYLTQSGGGNRTVLAQDGNQVSSFLLQYNAAATRWAVLAPTADQANPTSVLLTSTEPAPVADWTHLAVVYDAPARQLRLYVNGVLSAVKTGTTVRESSGPFTIGRGKWNGGNVDFFPRGIDDVRAFGRALSGGEVRLLHDDVTSAGFGFWRFDSDTASDYSWRDNHATLSGGTSYGEGVSGRALYLDGTSGSGTTAAYGTTMRDSFTVSAWAKLTRTDRVSTVLGQDGSRMSGYALQYRPDTGRWVLGARTSDSDGAALVSAQSTQPAVANQWVHLAGVYDYAARQLRLYVNGQLAGMRNNVALWLATGGLTIGRAKVNGQQAEFFAGAVDEVRMDVGLVADDELARRAGWPAPPPRVLGSFVNAAGDHYTASTNDPVPEGYHFESSLGMLVEQDQPGTHPLYACRFGTDTFTSLDPDCEGRTPVGVAGRVHSEQPAEVATIPVYRCRTATDRFDSLRPDCSGATVDGPLGYAMAYSPLARNYSRIGADHWVTVHGTPPSYHYEGTLGWLPLTEQAGTQRLMSCRAGTDQFISLDAGCEGAAVLGQSGWIWAEPPAESGSAPIYRCVMSNGHRFVSTWSNCENTTVDRLLGYVLSAPPGAVPASTSEAPPPVGPDAGEPQLGPPPDAMSDAPTVRPGS